MQAIFKFPLELVDNQDVEMPLDAEILHVNTQSDEPYIWALVNPEAPMGKRNISIWGTGDRMDESKAKKYIGTFMQDEGRLVWHVFELL